MSQPAVDPNVPAVAVSQDGPVYRIQFGRLDIDAVAIDALYDAIADIEEDHDARAVVIEVRPQGVAQGVAGAVCVSVPELGASDGLRAFSRMEKALSGIERMNKVAVCILDGPTGTLGLELAMVSDFRVATPSAQFSLIEVEKGVLPGMGVFRLARYTGLGRAKQAVLQGRGISSEEALRYGILDAISEGPEVEVSGALERFIRMPQVALTLARQMLNEGGTMDYRKAYEAYKAAQFHALHQLEEGA